VGPTPVSQRSTDVANGVTYDFSSSIYTRDVNQAFSAMRDIHAGITYVNAPTIGAEVHLLLRPVSSQLRIDLLRIDLGRRKAQC
jgi:hypothetical protein